MIRNANSEQVDIFILSARPESRLNESSSTLLNGGWVCQTIGNPAEVLKVRGVCRWTVIQEIMDYYKTKEVISVSFLDFSKAGFIMSQPSYEIAERDELNPKYSINFEMAVTGDV